MKKQRGEICSLIIVLLFATFIGVSVAKDIYSQSCNADQKECKNE